MPSVIAAFPSADKARRAYRELEQAGVPARTLRLVGPQNWFDAQAALTEPEQNVIAGRSGRDNPEMAAVTAAADILGNGDLPAIERQWLNHVLLVIQQLDRERVPGITVALRQLGAEHVVTDEAAGTTPNPVAERKDVTDG